MIQSILQIVICLNTINHNLLFHIPNKCSSIIQGTGIGTVIAQVIATDPDPGPAGELTYSFYSVEGQSEDAKSFHINPTTGAIIVTVKTDYERQKEYSVKSFSQSH